MTSRTRHLICCCAPNQRLGRNDMTVIVPRATADSDCDWLKQLDNVHGPSAFMSCSRKSPAHSAGNAVL